MDSPMLSSGVKRGHDGNPIKQELSPDSTKMHTMPGDIRISQRAASPALSTTSSSLSDVPSMSTRSQQPVNPSGSPAKKRKLTFAEREVEKAMRVREKQEKARLKAEEKMKKDEEKRRVAEEKEAEKSIKDMKKAEKDADKAEKKRAKAEKEAKVEAEKLKKERVCTPSRQCIE